MPFVGRVRVIHRGATIAETTVAMSEVDSSGAPLYYIPPNDVATDRLALGTAKYFNEWKGVATYWSVFTRGLLVVNAAWSYETPRRGYAKIRGYITFDARLMDECWVDDQRVMSTCGGPDAGWVTT